MFTHNYSFYKAQTKPFKKTMLFLGFEGTQNSQLILVVVVVIVVVSGRTPKTCILVVQLNRDDHNFPLFPFCFSFTIVLFLYLGFSIACPASTSSGLSMYSFFTMLQNSLHERESTLLDPNTHLSKHLQYCYNLKEVMNVKYYSIISPDAYMYKLKIL